MPAKDKHLDQYRSNRKLLEEGVFNIESSNHLDWIVTIAFYCAVHLVENELADLQVHFTNHVDRNKALYKTNKLLKISPSYITLENQSRRARYDCEIISKSDVIKSLNQLTAIEKIALPS